MCRPPASLGPEFKPLVQHMCEFQALSFSMKALELVNQHVYKVHELRPATATLINFGPYCVPALLGYGALGPRASAVDELWLPTS